MTVIHWSTLEQTPRRFFSLKSPEQWVYIVLDLSKQRGPLSAKSPALQMEFKLCAYWEWTLWTGCNLQALKQMIKKYIKYFLLAWASQCPFPNEVITHGTDCKVTFLTVLEKSHFLWVSYGNSPAHPMYNGKALPSYFSSYKSLWRKAVPSHPDQVFQKLHSSSCP